MPKQLYLIFRNNKTLYGIEVQECTEILQLPEISTPYNIQPPHIGYINCRGKVIPVLDICQILEEQCERDFCPSENLVIIKSKGEKLGLVIPEIIDIVDLEISPKDNVCHYESEIIHLIDHNKISIPLNDRYSENNKFKKMKTEQKNQEVFHQRALQLMKSEIDKIEAKADEYVVVKLNNEYYGISALKILEVSSIGHIVPLPNVSDQILGLMNIRGSNVLILDLPVLLGQQSKEYHNNGRHVLITRFQESNLGLNAGEAVDIISIKGDELQPFPNAEPWIQSIVKYQSDLLSILDIDILLASSYQQLQRNMRGNA